MRSVFDFGEAEADHLPELVQKGVRVFYLPRWSDFNDYPNPHLTHRCAIMKTHLLPIDVFTAALRLMGVSPCLPGHCSN